MADKDTIEESATAESAEKTGNYGFIKLAYGVVSEYKDTSKMTVEQVVEEFLKKNGVNTAKEYFEKTRRDIKQYSYLTDDEINDLRRAVLEEIESGEPDNLDVSDIYTLLAALDMDVPDIAEEVERVIG